MSETAATPIKKTRVTSKAKPKVSANAATPGSDQSPQPAKKAVTKTATKKSVAKPAAKKSVSVKPSEKPTQSQTTDPDKAGVTATAKPSATKAKRTTAAKKKNVSTPTPSTASAKAKATASKKPPVQPQIPNAETIDKMVAEAAYYLAEKRNFAVGFEEDDWVTAKVQVMELWQETNNL